MRPRKHPLRHASPILLASTVWWALGCDSFIPDPHGDAPAEVCDLTAAPLPEARLLTRSEYRRTVQALLGETDDPTNAFPHEPEVDGFDNNARSHRANPLLVSNFLRAAGTLALRAHERGFLTLFPCEGEDAVCAELFIEDFGRKAFRRPLELNERLAFKTLYSRLAPSLGHDGALTAIVEAALQSPQFLYRVEAPLTSAESGVVNLGPFELASRLSYFLWGTMPDDVLLDAAEAGQLATAADVERETRRLLADVRARERVREFYHAWLGLEPISSLTRDDAPEGMTASLEQSMDSFVDEIFWTEGARLADLFTSSIVYIDPTMASLYDLAPPTEGMVRRDLAPRRLGLLTQPAMMTLLANDGQSSPIRRGVFVRDRLLCAPVPAPPPTVDNSPPDPDPSLTTRERFAVHTENEDCAGCHLAIDPIGFAFEGFDHLGRARTEENGLPIDTSGALVDTGDAGIDGPVADGLELSQRLAQSRQVVRCATSKWFTFAMGHPLTFADECALAAAYARIDATQGNLIETLVALTTSTAFRSRSAHPNEDTP